jgi:hypothetical protein
MMTLTHPFMKGYSMPRRLPSAVLAAAVALSGPALLLAQTPPPLPPPPPPPPATQPHAPAPAPAADVPVKTVILYSSGVGYFEHAGRVTGNAETELRFKTQQINDILKSLVLEDLDGGHISTITYPSQDPVAKTLRSFAVDITANPSLADLFNQLRGAKVTVQRQDSRITGTILGVEKKKRPVSKDDKGEPVEIAVLNLVSEGSIQAIPMDSVQSLVLDDPELQAELNRALQTLAQARDQDKKPVTIHFEGHGPRRVRIGYIVETPIWKTSYRLLLGEDNAKPATATQPAGASQTAKLQGWAIVENQTDTDWKDVHLSLVSGRPISFIENLYQPLYIPRPIGQPDLYASLRPQTYEGGIAGAAVGGVKLDAALKFADPLNKERAAQQMQRDQKAAGDRSGFFRTATEAKRRQSTLDAAKSILSAASAAKLGELFQYTIDTPISLPRQRSAMIPIITDPIEVQRVSIYNQSVLPQHALTGARLKNITGKHLLTGPITVLDHGAYAGDAQIDNVPPDQQRLISYGIDLQLRVKADTQTATSLQSATLIKGVLTRQYKNVMSHDYVAANQADRDKILIIEHPIQRNWTLVDTDKPVETTETLYRFRVKVPAGKTNTFTVSEQQITDERVALLDCSVGQLVVYSKEGQIDDRIRAALAKAADMKRHLGDLQQQIQFRQQAIEQIGQEQGRMRENMRVVSQDTDYYKHLLSKLNDQETQIEKRQEEIQDLQKQAQQQQKDLEAYLSGLDLE